MIITKTCNTCEHYPNDKHCIGCVWDKSKGENTKWELKKNPIVIERAVLDKIREEIKSKKFGLTDTEDGRRIQSDIHAGFDGGIECALQIVDKYRAESEDKE